MNRGRKPTASEPDSLTGHVLLRDLVHATYWIDDGLQAYMRQRAGISLPRAQSMMMVYLAEGVDRPSDLAKRLRISKQAVQQGLKELIAKDMVRLEPDPTSGRQKIVRFTDHGRELRDLAREGLEGMERLLIQRIGKARSNGLRSALQENWGPAPGSDE